MRQLLRCGTGIAQTRSMVAKIVRIIVEAGTLTGKSYSGLPAEYSSDSCSSTAPMLASAAILVLVLYVAAPHHAYNTAVATLLGKFYSNALLAIFNSRTQFSPSPSSSRATASTSGHPTFLTFPEYDREAQSEATRRAGIELQVRVRRVVDERRPVFVNTEGENSGEGVDAKDMGGVHVQTEVCVTTDEHETGRTVSDMVFTHTSRELN